MCPALADASRSVVVAIDLQPAFLRAIHESARVLARSAFLLECAALLDVPVLATEQNPERMGGTEPAIKAFLAAGAFPKHVFSCVGCEGFDSALASMARTQIVLVGIETHICVNQTAHHLLASGYDVILAADALSARTPSMHAIGIERMRDAGAVVAHTESIVYEWLGSAAHPAFRDVLQVVKAAPAG